MRKVPDDTNAESESESTKSIFDRLLAKERARLKKIDEQRQAHRRKQLAEEAERRRKLEAESAERESRLNSARNEVLSFLDELGTVHNSIKIVRDSSSNGMAFCIQVTAPGNNVQQQFARRIRLEPPVDSADIGVLVDDSTRFRTIEALRKYLRERLLADLAIAIANASHESKSKDAGDSMFKDRRLVQHVGAPGGLLYSNPNIPGRTDHDGPWCSFCWGMPLASGAQCAICAGSGRPLPIDSPLYDERMFAAALASQLDRKSIVRLMNSGRYSASQQQQLRAALSNAAPTVSSGDMIKYSSIRGQD